jgi:hypothetical protein
MISGTGEEDEAEKKIQESYPDARIPINEKKEQSDHRME